MMAATLSVAALAQDSATAPSPAPNTGITWRLNTDYIPHALFHRKTSGGAWIDVTPKALREMAKETADRFDFSQNCALCPLDANRAWLAVNIQNRILVEYTSSGGKEWTEHAGPPASDWVCLSFLDEKEGFVMGARGSLGNHREWVYHTSDGGTHWQEMPSPTKEGSSYYANGIVFRTPLQGWITATYHGVPDVPFFHTTDGGRTWNIQTLDIPAEYRGGYGNTSPPIFVGKDKMHGFLPVELVNNQTPVRRDATIVYETDDGGITWRLPKPGLQR